VIEVTAGAIETAVVHIYHELNRLNDNLKYIDDRTLKMIAMNKLPDTRSASASSITYLQAHASVATSVLRQHRHAETLTITCS
jgi:hypothetical protein